MAVPGVRREAGGLSGAGESRRHDTL